MSVSLDAVIDAGVHFAGDFGTVVAGENDERVIGKPRALERVQHLTGSPIHLRHKVAVFARLTLALKRGRRHDGIVRRGQREVEEERLARRRFGGVLDVFHRPLR